MKLAVSNVCWPSKETESFIDLVAGLACDGIELAASMIWDEPVDSTPAQRTALRRRIEDAGLVVTGLQALLFTHPEIQLMRSEADRRAALDYLAGLAEVCADLGGEVMVFGSPGNRSLGDGDPDEAYRVAVEFFARAGGRAAESGVSLCIEPLGRTETDFINTVAEAERMIADAGDPAGLGLHIDTKGLIDEDEVDAPYLTRSFAKAMHVHVNDPELRPPGSTGFDHAAIRARIDGSGYGRFLSIEMRRQGDDVEGQVRQAVDYVRRVYFPK